jgi:hypothetical protein
MSFEDQLRDDLHAVPMPALRVPDRLADRALVGARRQNRLRSVAVAGIATLAAASAVPVLGGVLGGGGGTPGAEATCPTNAPLPARPPATGWEYFDPLRYEIDVSGVTEYEVSSYETSIYYQVLELRNAARDRLATVTLYATGGVVHYRTDDAQPRPWDPATGEPTEPVNGTFAYWLPETTDVGLPQGQGLAWQWAPGAWVLVTVADTSGLGAEATHGPAARSVAELRNLAAQLAPELAFGGGEPVRSPFSMAIPSCLRVGGTLSVFDTRLDGPPIARFGLRFEPEQAVGYTNPLIGPGSSDSFGVDASWASTPEDKPGSATSDVDGHPAALGDCPSADRCHMGTIYGVNGFALELQGSLAPQFGITVQDLYDAVQIHPGATNDPITWGPPVP